MENKQFELVSIPTGKTKEDIYANDNNAMGKDKTDGWCEINRNENTVLYHFIGTVTK